ncbi:MAG: alpha-isopropylmalate synthase regulatory domain-containing protein, partial [Gemmiger sp.]|nr:alpha-isopropylmalate synthase regulatory domain-containing protein [Gemmiger sp.]
AVSNAIEQTTDMHFTLVHYSEHALDTDTDSRACCYVGLQWASGTQTWGCGTDTDIIVAGIKALVSAINNK